MKKLITIMLIAVMALAVFTGCNQKKKEIKNPVYVTVYDGSKVVCAWEPVELKDEDKDSKMTINDVLVALHASKCKDGYASAEGQYGLSITKLWGDESGAFGYYVNDGMAMGLTDEVKVGDRIYAYVYSDKVYFGDVYTFFDTSLISGKAGKEVTVKLFGMLSYDENWNPVSSPIADATIIIDGKVTEYKTGEDGSVTITLPKENAVISATAAGLPLVPPVLVSSK